MPYRLKKAFVGSDWSGLGGMSALSPGRVEYVSFFMTYYQDIQKWCFSCLQCYDLEKFLLARG